MPDWDQTVSDREKGEVVGFTGHNEPVEGSTITPVANDTVQDIRKVAVDDVEVTGAKVPDAPSYPAPAPGSTVGTVESQLVDEGSASSPDPQAQTDGADEPTSSGDEVRSDPTQ